MKKRTQNSRGLTKNDDGITVFAKLRRLQRDLCRLCHKTLVFNEPRSNRAAIANHDPPFRTTNDPYRAPNQLICRVCDVSKQRQNAIKFPQRRASTAGTSRNHAKSATTSTAGTSRNHAKSATTRNRAKSAKTKKTAARPKRKAEIIGMHNQSERANALRSLRSFRHQCEICAKQLKSKSSRFCKNCFS